MNDGMMNEMFFKNMLKRVVAEENILASDILDAQGVDYVIRTHMGDVKVQVKSATGSFGKKAKWFIDKYRKASVDYVVFMEDIDYDMIGSWCLNEEEEDWVFDHFIGIDFFQKKLATICG